MIFYSCFIGFWLYVDPLSPSFGFNIDPLGKKNYFPFSSRRQITFIRLREMNILKTVVNHSIMCFETEFQNLWYKVTTDSHKVTFSPTFSLSPKTEIFRGNLLWLGARMTQFYYCVIFEYILPVCQRNTLPWVAQNVLCG